MKPLNAPKTQQFEKTLVPEGTHIARLYSIIHMGTIPEMYMGEEKEMNKIRLGFEFPEELHVFKPELGEQPLVHSQEYTLSFNEKARLRKVVEGIRGKALTDEECETFDILSLTGKPCLINVIHKVSKAGNTRVEIASVTPLMKNQTAPLQVNESKVLTYENWNEELFEKLPDFLKDKIKSSKEYREMMGLEVDTTTYDAPLDEDGVPF